MEDYRRLIISDLHLGSVFSREHQVFELLKREDYDELILAGDIIDFIKMPAFSDATADLFNYLCEKHVKIVYIIGNHDLSFKKFSGKMINGITFCTEYNFLYHGRRYRIEHGDKYESGVVHWPLFMPIVATITSSLERYFNFDISTWFEKMRNKKRKLIKIWDIVKWNNDADVFIMGHTHNPEVLIWVDKEEKIKTYVNTGDWVQHATYVTINNGQVRLKNFLLENQVE